MNIIKTTKPLVGCRENMLRLFALGLVALFSPLSVASAQDWSFEPVVKLGVESDDNADLSIFTAQEFEVTGLIAEASGKFSYNSATSNFSLTPRIRSRNYDVSELDSDDVFLVGDFRQRFQSNTFGIRANYEEESVRTAERDDSDLDVEDISDITNDGNGLVQIAGTRDKLRLRPSWSYEVSNVSSIGLTLDYYDVSYDTDILTDLNDYNDSRLEFSYGYRFSPVNRGIFLASGRQFESDRVTKDFDGTRVMAGIEHSFSETIDLRVLMGIESVDFVNSTAGSENETVGEITLSRRLQTVTILAGYRRAVTASGSTPTIRDNFNLNFTRQLSDTISAGLGARAYTTGDLDSSSDRERNYVQLRGTLGWSLTPVLDLQFDYRHTILDRGDDLGERADSNIVGLSFVYRPNSPKVL